MEYREKFEMLVVAPLRREERVMLDSIFLNGLEEEIQAEVKLYGYHDLADLMDRTLLLDEKNEAMGKKGITNRDKGEWKDKGVLAWFRSPGEFYREKKEGRGRRLSPSELEERSKKGLCFKSGEKWGKDHMCKFKHMSLRLCEGSSSEEEGEWEVKEEKEEEVRGEMRTLQLSLQSREGLTTNKSFKVWAEKDGRKVFDFD
ncbi:hypothetical protein A2U01_0020654 [Trifolium medium]|uniref:Uncharacterized protein n=1 Tax=Trifolium medium TaxID=97028 RepID=A0A392NII4_9FABA|nr:hypothetical protein [Trifolium medium]